MQSGISLSKNGIETKSALVEKLLPESAEYCKTPIVWQMTTPAMPSKIFKRSVLKRCAMPQQQTRGRKPIIKPPV